MRRLNLVSETTSGGPRSIGRGPLEELEDVESPEAWRGWESGHCHPFIGWFGVTFHRNGTTDKTATGLCEAGSYEVPPSDRRVSSG